MHTSVINVRDYAGRGLPADATYVGRPVPRHRLACVKAGSPFGNPKRLKGDLRAYLAHVQASADLLALLPSLKGKRLACWCCSSTPATEGGTIVCHAQVLAMLADGHEIK